MSKQYKFQIVAWETDSQLNPTGKQRFFIANSCREVARQIAYELGGEARQCIVWLHDGKGWATEIYGRVKND